MKNKIINLCPTGVIPKKKDNPNTPINIKEIVDDVEYAASQGAQIAHLHARDKEGNPSSDPGIYSEIISEIDLRKINIIKCVSTSGRVKNDFENRSMVLDINNKPDMASLTLSSLNFITGASVNQPELIERLAKKMYDNGIVPELEVFDIGMLNYLNYLIRKNIIKPPYYINIILGNISSAQPTLGDIAALKNHLPSNSVVCLGGIGQFQQISNIMGLIYFDGVRVGLEDNIYFDKNKKVYAKNKDLIDRINLLINNFQFKKYTIEELKEKIHN